MSSNPSQVKFGVRNTSVLSRTETINTDNKTNTYSISFPDLEFDPGSERRQITCSACANACRSGGTQS